MKKEIKPILVETTLADIKKKIGDFSQMGTNPVTQRPLVLKITNKKVHKMLQVIKKEMTGEWYKEDLGYQFYHPIKVHVDYNTETNFWVDYMSDNLLQLRTKDYQLQIFPFDDGLMVHSLIVNDDKRGQGIGTDVMNKLYDISEEIGIPLYVIPFPATDSYDQSKIFEIVKPLHKWYEELGFGHLEGRGLLWCNY